jgi:N-acyl-D-amino-acid deacylase
MFPYTAAATMMIAIYPPWALEGGVDRLIERLKDRKTRWRIERDIEKKRPLSAFCTDAEDYGRGSPHPAAYGAFASILSKYVRKDRALTLEEAVRKMTSYPARIFGLKDLGVIRPGAFADLTIFDPSRVNDRASFEKPRREPTGIEMVIINGRVAFENNQALGDMPGSAIRNGV